jgi:hypothetical protein
VLWVAYATNRDCIRTGDKQTRYPLYTRYMLDAYVIIAANPGPPQLTRRGGNKQFFRGVGAGLTTLSESATIQLLRRARR